LRFGLSAVCASKGKEEVASVMSRPSRAIENGSARATHAVFRALAEHFERIDQPGRATPTGEGAGRNGEGACAPQRDRIVPVGVDSFEMGDLFENRTKHLDSVWPGFF